MLLDKRTTDNLRGLHPDLIKLIKEAAIAPPLNFTVTCGVRSAVAQAIAYKAGNSKCDGVIKKSEHQTKADGYGHAFDAYPLPINYTDMKKYTILANHFKATAKKLKINIKWGGEFKTFIDRPHYELA